MEHKIEIATAEALPQAARNSHRSWAMKPFMPSTARWGPGKPPSSANFAGHWEWKRTWPIPPRSRLSTNTAPTLPQS